jgi:hypothetical protein
MSTSEQHRDNDPRQRLVSLLQVDFTPPEKEVLAQEAGNNLLMGLLASVRSIEDIDARYSSDENIELGQAVERLVEPAPVTDSFKGFIAHKVREAYAWEQKVDDMVSPDRLGLLHGDGIFDSERAQEIEAQTLRGYVFDIMNRYTVTPDTDDADLPPLLLMPGVRPSDYTAALERLRDWASDYIHTYHEDPFEGLQGEAYLAAAQKAHVMSKEEIAAREQDPLWMGFYDLLRQLYKEDRSKGDQE